MPDRNDRFSDKEDRMAEHVKQSEKKRGDCSQGLKHLGF
jgi:hypothetical protein